MGGGVSAHQNDSVLSSTQKVEAAHLTDRYRIALAWSEEVLRREQRLCGVMGFAADAHYNQPLMMEKMERSLTSLDDASHAHCQDQQRSCGHAEVHSVSLTSAPHVILPLGDDSTLAWAAADGPICVYNWREGQVVSQMRADHSTGSHETAVCRLCVASDTHRHIASGDEHGDIELWDLTQPASVLHVRLHEQAISGLQREFGQNLLFSTSGDSYIMTYDLTQQQVVESAFPNSCDCGSGVANTVLGISEEMRKIILVGAADGKMRIWSRGDGPMRRLSTLGCLGGQPRHCQVAVDGWRAVIGTVPANPALISPKEVRDGGLLAFDLRCLGGSSDDADSRALIASWDAGPGNATWPGVPAATTTGVVDMALVEEGGQTRIMCIVDNTVRAFGLDGAEFSEQFHAAARADEDYDMNLCALGASSRFVFVGTSTPSVGVWRRTRADEPFGHQDYSRDEPLPPLLLRATCMPLQQSRLDLEPGEVLAHVENALEHDRRRIASRFADFGGKEWLTSPVGRVR